MATKEQDTDMPTSYIQRLKMTDKELAISEAQSRAAEVEAEISAKMSSVKAQIVRANTALNHALSRYPLDLGLVKSNQEKINALQDALDAYRDVYIGLFPGE